MKKTISLFLLMGGFFFSSWDISAQNKISLPDMDLSLATSSMVRREERGCYR